MQRHALPAHATTPVPGADRAPDSSAAVTPPAPYRAGSRTTTSPSQATEQALVGVPGDGYGDHDRSGHRLVQPGQLVATRAGRLDLWHASDVPDRCRGGTQP